MPSRHLNYSEVEDMKEDPTINRIREARHRISEVSDHDPRKLIKYYMELHKRHQDRLIQKTRNEEEAADDLVKA